MSKLLETRSETSKELPVRPFRTVLFFSLLIGCFLLTTHYKLGSTQYFKITSTERTQSADHILRTPPLGDIDDFNLQHEAQFFLNDKSIRLSPYVPRPWLAYHETKDTDKPFAKPRRKLVLTDYGWNHPDTKKGLAEFPRSLRSRELLQAFVDHPDFDPTFSWQQSMERRDSIDNSLEYIVFPDFETCFESNYPNQGGTLQINADTQHGRIVNDKAKNPCYSITSSACMKRIDAILESPLFQAVNASTLLWLDCRGFGPSARFRETRKTRQVSILTLSSGPENRLTDTDMGMPPPAVNPMTLSRKEKQEIHSCQSEGTRTHLLTFVGSDRGGSPRGSLFELHNGDDVFLMMKGQFKTEKEQGNHVNKTYETLLTKTKFAAAPRGDNRFSYRFTEVMSAGAIPVVHSDGWILPFSTSLIDWSQCAVVIPEAQMNQTVAILRQIGPDQRCRMRKYCYEMYQKYMVNPEANIAGVLASIDEFRRNEST